MFTSRLRLFRLWGIGVSADASWLIILALVTWTLATTYFPAELANARPPEYWLLGLVTALAFFGCILLHEMGHALVGRSFGMPIRGITLFLFGGVAELGGEPQSASAEFFMATAGPAVSVLLAGGFRGLEALASQNGALALAVVCHYLAAINVLVILFNLVPAFPLDGGRVFRSILWGLTGSLRRATYWAALTGQAFAWLLIAWGVLDLFEGQMLGGIWMGLIGMFLNNAARSSYQQVVLQQALAGESVRHFMNTEPIVVPPSLDLRHWVDDYVYRYHRKSFPVAADGALEGFISTSALSQLPRDEWPNHTVGELMRRDLGAITISPDADALRALGKMQGTGSSRLLVVEGDRLVGIVSLKDLLRFLHLKVDLQDVER